MGKARNGAGSVRRRTSGKLKGKFRAQWGYDDPVTGEYVTVDKTFPTEREASDYLADLQAKVRTGQMVQEASRRKVLTLNAWFEELAGTRATEFKGRWLDDGGLPLTVSTKAIRYNRHVKDTFLGSMAIRSITVDHVRTFYRVLRESGRSEATIHDVKAVLVKVVNDAIDTYEKLPNLRNVFAKVKVTEPPAREAIALTVEQAQKALAKLTDPEDRAMLGLYLLAGLRLSEQMAICKEQIDFKTGLILIDRAIKLDRKGTQTVGLPKCGKVRSVVMCPSLADLLCPIMDGPMSHLFACEQKDKARMKKVIYGAWARIVKESGLPAGLTPKDARLSHNNWIEKLMPTVSTSTRLEHMGHSVSRTGEEHKGIVVNLRNYTRVLSASQVILRDELERVFTSPPQCPNEATERSS